MIVVWLFHAKPRVCQRQCELCDDIIYGHYTALFWVEYVIAGMHFKETSSLTINIFSKQIFSF